MRSAWPRPSANRRSRSPTQEKVRDIGTKEAERERAVRIAELEKEKVVGEQGFQFEQEALVRDQEREMRIPSPTRTPRRSWARTTSKAEIAQTNADLRVREAEAYEQGETRYREAQAAVLEAQYKAEARAAEAEAEKVEAEKRAQLEAVSRAEKAKTIVDAEAEAEQRKIDGDGRGGRDLRDCSRPRPAASTRSSPRRARA